MALLTVASSSPAIAGRACTTRLPGPTKITLHQRSHQRTYRSLTKATLVDTGYTLADAVGKVADKAENAVGSVNAPSWVLPVS